MPSSKSSDEETMGQILRRIRDSKDISQLALAELAGVPIGTLRNWEQDRRIPRLDTAFRVAKALSVSLDELATDVPPRPKPKQKSRRKGGG